MAAIQGDWYAGRHQIDPQEMRYVYSRHNGEQYLVAKVWAGNDQDYESTAHLVAAAPELLSQLRMAADFISGHNECLSAPSSGGDRQWNEYCIGLLEDCKAAIDKAEGRSE